MDEDTHHHMGEDPEYREADTDAEEAAEELREEAAAAEARLEAAEAAADEAAEETWEGVEARLEPARRSADEAAEAAERMRAEAREARAELGATVRTRADDFATAPREPIIATEEAPVVPEYRVMSFTDGFRFGCGFTVATCLFWVVLSILLALIPVVLSALNVLDFG
jgi:uncharacterized membrane protein YccC